VQVGDEDELRSRGDLLGRLGELHERVAAVVGRVRDRLAGLGRVEHRVDEQAAPAVVELERRVADEAQSHRCTVSAHDPHPGSTRRWHTRRVGGPLICVIEDEHAIADAVAARLRAEGFAVEVAHDGPAGIALCERLLPDLVILDLLLPGIDGLEVCRRIQRSRPVPVLMLTALDAETDMLVGLGVGADDYMTKPFSMRELAARVNALVRRVARARVLAEQEGDPPPLTLGPVEVDRAERRVRRDGDEVHLTPTEFDLLVRLASSPRTVLTRETLLADVWDWADASGTRTVDSHVKALRRKLGPGLIRTVHGVGYSAEPTPPDKDDADDPYDAAQDRADDPAPDPAADPGLGPGVGPRP
jgi:DNA-binding response OmpR family regulator